MLQLVLFFRIWFWFSFRQLWVQRWRTLAVLAGIVLGAAVFTSVRLAVNASVNSFSRSMDILSGKADRVVVNPGGRVPDYLVGELLRHSSVRAASPLLTMYVQINESGGEPVLLVGLDPILDRPFRNLQLTPSEKSTPSYSWLDLLSEPNTVLLGPKFSDKLEYNSGERLVMEYARCTNAFRALGVLGPEGLAKAEGGDIAITDISTFQEFTALHGYVDRIDIILKPNATVRDVEEIQAMLPSGIFLQQRGETKESGRLMIRSYQLNLSVLSFVSLFVGMFLVYSLVALHVTSRRHEVAVLRSIGASSRLIFFVFLAEGAFFGVAGWLVAIPVGSLVVKQLVGGVSHTITHLFVRVQADSLVLDPWEVFGSFAITLFISILAACQPAREAMRVPPREALMMLDTCLKRANSAFKLSLLGLLLIVLVWPLSKIPATSGMPIWGYIATFSLFAGFSLLSPWLMRLIGSSLPNLLRHLGGEPAYLGARYIRDAGTRIAISTGALITAIALFVALAIMVHSFRNTVEVWVNQSITGDLFLRPTLSDVNQNRDPVPEGVASTLRSMENKLDLLPYRRIHLRYGTIPYQLEAIDLEVFSRHASFLLIDGKEAEVLPKLMRGEGVLVSEVFANQTGLGTGRRYRANVAGTILDLPILGISRDYRTQGGVVHVSLPYFAEVSGDNSWSGVRIHLKNPGDDAQVVAVQVRKEILQSCIRQEQTVQVIIGNDLRREILRIFDETFAVTTVLLIIALFVAALGITTTLTVLVLERSRELHTLIAGGASIGQVRSMIFWEAILMVFAGESLGLACGLMLSRLLIFVINRQSFGWTFIYSIDWASLLISLPLVLATALLAALPASQLVFKRSTALVLRER